MTMTIHQAAVHAERPAKEQTKTQWFIQHALKIHQFLNRSLVYRFNGGTIEIDHKAGTVTF